MGGYHVGRHEHGHLACFLYYEPAFNIEDRSEKEAVITF